MTEQAARNAELKRHAAAARDALKSLLAASDYAAHAEGIGTLTSRDTGKAVAAANALHVNVQQIERLKSAGATCAPQSPDPDKA